jgi:phosphate transport system substrate-binding protein
MTARRVLTVLLAAALTACAPAEDPAVGAGVAGDSIVDLTGAGATFPYPVYAKWISRFAGETGLRINYRSVGTGDGLRQLREGAVDFGASDVPLDTALSGDALMQLPLVVGAVVVAYNLPELTEPLQLDGDVLADIFMGRLPRWDDARIRALNPGVALPNVSIKPITRLDPSGTTKVFSRYLADASPAFAAQLGSGLEVLFPTGMTRAGNEGLASEIKVTYGAIGYIEQSYATLNRLPHARLRNASGAFVSATPAALTAAAASARGPLRADGFPGSLLGATAPEAYPVAAFSWLILRPDAISAETRRTLPQFVRWTQASGAEDAEALGYAPLPPAVRRRVEAAVDALAAGGRAP